MIYRFTNGQLRHYGNPDIAASWNPSWANGIVNLTAKQCQDIPKGKPMPMKADVVTRTTTATTTNDTSMSTSTSALPSSATLPSPTTVTKPEEEPATGDDTPPSSTSTSTDVTPPSDQDAEEDDEDPSAEESADAAQEIANIASESPPSDEEATEGNYLVPTVVGVSLGIVALLLIPRRSQP
jgi:hypothetical protein